MYIKLLNYVLINDIETFCMYLKITNQFISFLINRFMNDANVYWLRLIIY